MEQNLKQESEKMVVVRRRDKKEVGINIKYKTLDPLTTRFNTLTSQTCAQSSTVATQESAR